MNKVALMETPANLEHQKKINALIAKEIIMPYDRLLIVPDDGESRTASGIIIPDTAVEKPRKGVVVAVGPDCKGTDDPTRDHLIHPVPVSVGAYVVYGKYAGSELKLDGTECIICRETDILFIIPQGVEVRIDLM